jgi:hypothetical protein
MAGAMTRPVVAVLAALAIAVPARGQAPDPFLSVPARPNPAPAVPRPAPAPATPRPIPPPAPPVAPPPPVATTFGDKGFHCPAAGTVVTRDYAGKPTTVRYSGADPADPEACLASSGGDVVGYLFGIVRKDNASAADFAAAYRKVLTGPPGTVAQFTSRDGLLGSTTAWHERFETEALETLQIGGEARPTIRIAVTETGIFGNGFEGTWHRWFDVQTGAEIRQSFQPSRGQAPTNQDWTATSIAVPKP